MNEENLWGWALTIFVVTVLISFFLIFLPLWYFRVPAYRFLSIGVICVLMGAVWAYLIDALEPFNKSVARASFAFGLCLSLMFWVNTWDWIRGKPVERPRYAQTPTVQRYRREPPRGIPFRSPIINGRVPSGAVAYRVVAGEATVTYTDAQGRNKVVLVKGSWAFDFRAAIGTTVVITARNGPSLQRIFIAIYHNGIRERMETCIQGECQIEASYTVPEDKQIFKPKS